jgi:transposase
LPIQRGNVSHQNRHVIHAIFVVAENRCKWRALAKRFGNWPTSYTRMNRWAKAGVPDRLFFELQRGLPIRIRFEAVSLDSTIVKVHRDGTGALRKAAHRPSANPAAAGAPKCIWLPRVLDAS